MVTKYEPVVVFAQSGGPIRAVGNSGSWVSPNAAIPAGRHVMMPLTFVEAAANLLTNEALDPYGKIPEFKYCVVKDQGRQALGRHT
ncbi:MAG: hypothetical protein ACRED0_01085 [Gammaproteobacteria bacterium]